MWQMYSHQTSFVATNHATLDLPFFVCLREMVDILRSLLLVLLLLAKNGHFVPVFPLFLLR